MKIAIFIDEFPIRSQTFVLNQIFCLISLGHEVEVLSLYKGDLKLLISSELTTYQLETRCRFLLSERKGRLSLLFERLKTIFKGLFSNQTRSTVLKGLSPCYKKQATNMMLSTIAAQHKTPLSYDWIIAHFGSSGVVANNLREIGVLKGKLATIFHGLDISAELEYPDTQYHYQRLFAQSELLLPISNLWREKLVALGASRDKLFVHRMGIDLQKFNYTPPKEIESALTVMCIARFSEKKGITYALKALSKLGDKLNFKFNLVGYGELETEIQKEVIALGLQQKVCLQGALPPEKVLQALHHADVYIQPSITASNGDKEGVPVSLMEAMACGVPVISTYHSGIPELIEHNVSGLLVHEKDIDGLAGAIHQLATSFELRTRLSKGALDRVKDISDLGKLNKELIMKFETTSVERLTNGS